MAISQDQAHQLLQQHYDKLFQSVYAGYDGYRKYPDRTIHRRTTRANIVNDRIIARVIEEFDEIPGAHYREVKQSNLRFLEIDGKVLLWFKKMDRLHRSKNYPTDHMVEQIEAGKQLSMFPDLDLLVVGYLLNRDESKVIRVSVAKPDGHGNKPRWFIDLDRPANTSLSVISSGRGGKPAPRVRVKLSEPQLGLFGQ